jgi:hypothetical protein
MTHIDVGLGATLTYMVKGVPSLQRALAARSGSCRPGRAERRQVVVPPSQISPASTTPSPQRDVIEVGRGARRARGPRKKNYPLAHGRLG